MSNWSTRWKNCARGIEVEAHLHADLREHRGDRGADALVVHVAVVRADEAQLEAVRDSPPRRGAASRLGDVVRQQARLQRREAARGGGHHRAGGPREPAHHLALDRLDVDRVVERLAHAQVLQRVLPLHVRVLELVALLVHHQEDHAVLEALDHLHLRVLLQARDVLERRVEHEVHLAGDQRGHARGVGLDRAVDDLVDVALEALVGEAPPLRVLAQRRGDLRLALDQDERARCRWRCARRTSPRRS